ncbi:hypothetical protein DSCW_28930 [Desulfosarcina widdelii]|uniref:Uncharacterized protein n=1 Tax=Desulfosarcina widdelii TaxID=947919 RepID=A0A5K7Z1B0_9BACT|nr:hypothetical protein DSCW_28930 [Desulfosarcina widdelii]
MGAAFAVAVESGGHNVCSFGFFDKKQFKRVAIGLQVFVRVPQDLMIRRNGDRFVAPFLHEQI